MADNQATKIEEASKLNVRVALTYLTYTSEQIKLENKKIKQEQLKNKL